MRVCTHAPLRVYVSFFVVTSHTGHGADTMDAVGHGGGDDGVQQRRAHHRDRRFGGLAPRQRCRGGTARSRWRTVPRQHRRQQRMCRLCSVPYSPPHPAQPPVPKASPPPGPRLARRAETARPSRACSTATHAARSTSPARTSLYDPHPLCFSLVSRCMCSLSHSVTQSLSHCVCVCGTRCTDPRTRSSRSASEAAIGSPPLHPATSVRSADT
jgi:hypothetical protein